MHTMSEGKYGVSPPKQNKTHLGDPGASEQELGTQQNMPSKTCSTKKETRSPVYKTRRKNIADFTFTDVESDAAIELRRNPDLPVKEASEASGGRVLGSRSLSVWTPPRQASAPRHLSMTTRSMALEKTVTGQRVHSFCCEATWGFPCRREGDRSL